MLQQPTGSWKRGTAGELPNLVVEIDVDSQAVRGSAGASLLSVFADRQLVGKARAARTGDANSRVQTSAANGTDVFCHGLELHGRVLSGSALP